MGTSDPGKLINLGRRFLDAGVERLMIESEGITENVKSWRTDVVSQIMKELPQEKVMFEGKLQDGCDKYKCVLSLTRNSQPRIQRYLTGISVNLELTSTCSSTTPRLSS